MEITIEKLIYGGDGLARGPAGEQGRGKAVFVPFVLAGEQVEVEVTEEKPGFMRARAAKILQASPERVPAPCPYFEACGGCHYQHTGYDRQLAIKKEILRETIRRLAKADPPPIREHASPPWHYRNRTRMKVRASGQSGHEFAIGYYRFNSHQLLPVEQCPISSPLINRALLAIWRLGREGLVGKAVQEIEFFADAEDACLLIELLLQDEKAVGGTALVKFVAALREAVPQVAGVALFRRGKPEGKPGLAGSSGPEVPLVRQPVPKDLKDMFGDEELRYRTRCCEFRVSAGSFFQTNRHMTDTLVDLVTAERLGDTALDLYAGTGLFTLPLAQCFREVTAIEAAPYSFADLRRNSPPNVDARQGLAEKFLSLRNGRPDKPFDLVVVDPPRAGMGEAAAAKLGNLPARRITYVSCDPATLARDVRVLLASGFRMEEMHLVDLFPQTFHIESVTQLVR